MRQCGGLQTSNPVVVTFEKVLEDATAMFEEKLQPIINGALS